MIILITGAAGFIGMHLAAKLLAEGHTVIGVDNFNDYYDPKLKEDRILHLKKQPGAENFTLIRGDIANMPTLTALFEQYRPEYVVNLAAQAGVRYSILNPSSYIQTNLVGFGNILECCRNFHIKHLVYASSSSVYGLNQAMPYRVEDPVNHPVSLYAATKKSNELMAHSYSHLFQIPTTGLRFFTVYGPWGRPDMALDLFSSAILAGRPIKVFNHGKMRRDFTYIDDIVEGVARLIPLPAQADPHWDARHPNPATSPDPWRIFNIGNHDCIELIQYIESIEKALGKEAVKEYLPMQDGDVAATYADTEELTRITGFNPHTPLEKGLSVFAAWYKEYYRKN